MSCVDQSCEVSRCSVIKPSSEAATCVMAISREACEVTGEWMAGRKFEQLRQECSRAADALAAAEQRCREAREVQRDELMYEDIESAADDGLETFLEHLALNANIRTQILQASGLTRKRLCQLHFHPDKHRQRSEYMNGVFAVAAAKGWV